MSTQAFETNSPVGFVDLDAVKRREGDVVNQEMRKQANKGVGVTEQGQEIYDAIAKTLPCRWDGKSILAVEEVQIDPLQHPELQGQQTQLPGPSPCQENH